MSELRVDLRGTHGAAVIILAGELDLATAGLVEERLAEAEASGPSLCVLDLSGLTFIDSSGLRVILAADARARADARRLIVVRGPASVRRVFLVTSLDHRLEFVDDLDAALRSEGR